MTVPIGNQTITAILVSYTDSVDKLGVRTKTETQMSISGCSWQPLSTVETLGDIDEVTSHWKLFAPPGINLSALDAVITPWDGLRYSVDGDPQPWTDFFGAPSHQEILFRRATG